MKITNSIVEAHLNCKYKAYLLLKGETGTPHDYEVLMNELQAEYRPKATEALLRRCKLESAPSIPTVTVDDLKQGHQMILNCTVETDQFQFHFDALRKVEGKSSLGSFDYQPVTFHHDDTVRERSKLLLAFGALVIGQIQACQPDTGMLIFNQTCKLTRLRFAKRSQKVVGLLDHLRQISVGTVVPNVRLNKHCDVCEFRDR